MKKKQDRMNRTAKIIEKRFRIIKMWAKTSLRRGISFEDRLKEFSCGRQKHRLHKWNLRCNCRQCRTKENKRDRKENIKKKIEWEEAQKTIKEILDKNKKI